MTSSEIPMISSPQNPVAEPELLQCLRKIGKALIASGTSVGVVENTLTKIALAYQVPCEIIALPNILMIKLGQNLHELTDINIQRPATVLLHQTSALVELIDQVLLQKIRPADAAYEVDRLLATPPRFNALIVVIGYMVSIIGLTLRFRPDGKAVIITGIAGLLVGLLILLFNKWPRFNLLLPIIAAILVSTLIFKMTQLGFIVGPVNLIIPPLVIFLPGAILTTGMIELASQHLISGTSRLIYGATTLLFLLIGIAVGLEFSNLPSILVSSYEATVFPWWVSVLGTFLFGVGTFIRLSGANRDLFWMLLVLYVAMFGQDLGDHYVSSYFGAFFGAMLMALCSELIARSPRRTPALASQAIAFWFLVPGARGLLSVTNILSKDLQSALAGLGETLILIIAIALGVFLGTLIVSADKFIPITSQQNSFTTKSVL